MSELTKTDIVYSASIEYDKCAGSLLKTSGYPVIKGISIKKDILSINYTISLPDGGSFDSVDVPIDMFKDALKELEKYKSKEELK